MKYNKVREELYLLAAIETIVNNNSSTDLGDTTLEYQLRVGDIPRVLIEDDDTSLDIMVRSRDNETGKLEDGEIFYKILEKNKMPAEDEKDAILDGVLNMSVAEKLDFILRREGRFSKKKFKNSVTFSPSDFFEGMGLEDLDCFDYPVTTFGINLSPESQKVLHERVEEYLAGLRQGIKPEEKQNKMN